MNVNEEKFWQELRRSAEPLPEIDTQELAAAERLLAADQSEPIPLSEEQIQAIVRRALAVEPASAVTPTVDRAPTGRTTGTLRRLLPRTVAAAAAVLLSPKGLLAATALSVVAASALLLQRTTVSLPFQQAVAILLDERTDVANRIAAQGRVAMDVIETVRLVQPLQSTPAFPQIGAAATQLLRRAGARLRAPASRPSKPREVSLLALGDHAVDSAAAPEERIEALRQLADLVTAGIEALRYVGEHTTDASTKAKNAAYLQRLEMLLP